MMSLKDKRYVAETLKYQKLCKNITTFKSLDISKDKEILLLIGSLPQASQNQLF
jgi:hypothetical protein